MTRPGRRRRRRRRRRRGGGADLPARDPARRHQPAAEHPALAPRHLLAAGRVPRGLPLARAAPRGAAGGHRQDAPLRAGPPRGGRHPRPRPAGAAGGAARRPARPGGGRGARRRHRRQPAGGHALQGGAPRARACSTARPASPTRMLVKVMNYNLALRAGPSRPLSRRGLRRPHPRRGGGLRGPHRPRRHGRRRGRSLGLRRRASSSSFRPRFRSGSGASRILVAETARTAGEVYGFCGLDPAAARGVCLQDKERIVDAGGTIRGNRKVELFYGFDEMGRHMRADANAGAWARMDPAARRTIVARSGADAAAFRLRGGSLDRKRAGRYRRVDEISE